ncbi:MAG: S-layer family protein [Cyanobacteria bacterium SBLK]|nr:S-layer family protein [Cyanobacteria bacterium SBLK]
MTRFSPNFNRFAIATICLLGNLTLFECGTNMGVKAQISGDGGAIGTLVDGSPTVPCTTGLCSIAGGMIQGNNLFHSFSQFSLDSSMTAIFNPLSPPTINNIIMRVTGGSVSSIDGLIAAFSAASNANLFLLNPNGIIFGANAELSIGGSFIATTATAFKFADGTVFSAGEPQNPPNLTVNLPPSGLVFSGNSGEIINRSQAFPGSFNSLGQSAGLAVNPGNTIALIGGNVTLENGNITAGNPTVDGGRIELGSVSGSGEVNLSQISEGFSVDYSNIQSFGDIQLTDNSVVDASGLTSGGGGAIQIRGNNITINNSAVTSSSFDTSGENLRVDASVLEISGMLNDGRTAGFFTQTQGSGNAGNTIVRTNTLTVRDGGFIAADTMGSGQGGTIAIEAIESVNLSSSNGSFSGISSSTFADARAGNVEIATQQLTLTDGTQIFSSTGGAGNAGNVTIDASNGITVSGERSAPSGIFTQVNKATGNGGNIALNGGTLIVENGGQISASTRTSGTGGSVTINAGNSVIVRGSGTQENSSIFSVTRGSGDGGRIAISSPTIEVEDRGTISASSNSTGDGGNIALDAGTLTIETGGRVAASTFNSGAGGSIRVDASDFVTVRGSSTENSGILSETQGSGDGGRIDIIAPAIAIVDDGEISAASDGNGNGGSIALDAGTLTVETGGRVSASTFNSGAGGSIRINASDSVTVRGNSTGNSGILSETQGSGKGGSINVTAPTVFVEENGTISVSGDSTGNAGNIDIRAPQISMNNGTIEAQTESGSGGDIHLYASDYILMFNQSLISATAGEAEAPGDGGNISITTTVLSGFGNSDITANSFLGIGGKIDIIARGIFGLKFRDRLTPDNDITAFSLFDPSLNGEVNLQTPDIDPTQGLTEEIPPEDPELIARGCDAGGEETGSFVTTGRGGIQRPPGEALSGNAAWDDLRPLHSDTGVGKPAEIAPPPTPTERETLIEAQGWERIGNGRVKLTATSARVAPANFPREKSEC